MSDSKPEIVQNIPEPAVIRARLDDLRQEARVLRALLSASDARERLTKKREVSRGK